LRGFSAPVVIRTDQTGADIAALLRYDPDVFARWDAGQRYATRLITTMASDRRLGRVRAVDADYTASIATLLSDKALTPRALAEILTLPDERTLGEEGPFIDVDGVHWARNTVAEAIAECAENSLWNLYEENRNVPPEGRDNAVVGGRKLKFTALGYLSRLPGGAARGICLDAIRTSSSYTEQVMALNILAERDGDEREAGLSAFRERNGHDQLALDAWYRAQISAAREDTPARVEALMAAEDFIPVFSRMFTFCDHFFYRNRYGLNAPDFSGYQVFKHEMLKLDARTPMLAGWTVMRSDFTRWWKFDAGRQDAMRSVLREMIATPGIGEGLFEVCSNALDADPQKVAA
jgi:aminopeptidase N